MVELPCAECRGQCCTYPAMSKQEFKRIKAVHGLPNGARVQKLSQFFGADGTRSMDHLTISMEDGTCPYLKDGRCSVYPLRPKVCRDYGVSPKLPCAYLYPERADASFDSMLQSIKERHL